MFPISLQPYRNLSQLIIMIALRNLVIHSLVPLPPNLGLEVQIHQLILFGLPLAVGIPVVHHLAASRILDLDRRVGEGALGGPLELVTPALLDGEGLGAAHVAVAVDALFDGKVEDAALGDGVAGWGLFALVDGSFVRSVVRGLLDWGCANGMDLGSWAKGSRTHCDAGQSQACCGELVDIHGVAFT